MSCTVRITNCNVSTTVGVILVGDANKEIWCTVLGNFPFHRDSISYSLRITSALHPIIITTPISS